MKYVYTLLHILKHFFKNLPEYIIQASGWAISLLIFFMIVSLIAFAFGKVFVIYEGFSNYSPGNVLHDTALLIVIIKAYKVLLYYYRKQRVSMKYIVEISIIASAIEIIFTVGELSIWMTVLLAAFGVANLIIYIFFYEKLVKIDEREYLSDAEIELEGSPQKPA